MRTVSHRLLWPVAYLILAGAGRCAAASANSTLGFSASALLTHAGIPLAVVLPQSALHVIQEITSSLAEVEPLACIPDADGMINTDLYMYNGI